MNSSGLPHGYETMANAVSRSRADNVNGWRLRAFDESAIFDPGRLAFKCGYADRETHPAADTLMEGRTSFVIAHRLSTVRRADMILVM